MEKERHDDILRGQNQVTEDLRVGFPGDNLSQVSVDDDLLLDVIPVSVVETGIEMENFVGVKDNVDENLNSNDGGNKVVDEESDSGSSVDDDQLVEASPVSVVETGIEMERTAEVEDNVDENLTSNCGENNIEDEETDSGSGSGESDDESLASKPNNAGLLDPETGVIHEISLSGPDAEDHSNKPEPFNQLCKVFPDGPKSTDYPQRHF